MDETQIGDFLKKKTTKTTHSVFIRLTDNKATESSLICWDVDLERKQGPGREITQSGLSKQGNIVRPKTIRAHREATEIAAARRHLFTNLNSVELIVCPKGGLETN